MTEEEEWRIIPNTNCNYCISNMGEIMNNNSQKILKPILSTNGYYQITIRYDKIKKNPRIHRLVAETFIPNLENLKSIDHINRNKLDNRVSNLRWVSTSNNMRNIEKKINKTSKYIGVYFAKQRNKYHARGRLNGKSVCIGYFDNEEDAGRAYNDWVIKNEDIKEFCVLNEII
jgi:hypothetical protein